MSSSLYSVFKREVKSYFYSPTAFIFITLFLFASNIFTFYIGNILENNEASLLSFFSFLPYIFLIFMPALSMRLWAEEKKTGTIELLLTLPLSNRDLVLGKFFASWFFSIIALLGTFPLWINIMWLGNPDNFVIFFSYIASILLSGIFLSVGALISCYTNNQVIAFILSTVTCFILLVTGFPMISNFFTSILPAGLLDIFIQFSLLSHYENLLKGYWHLSSVIYFLSLISLCLGLNEVKIASIRKKG